MAFNRFVYHVKRINVYFIAFTLLGLIHKDAASQPLSKKQKWTISNPFEQKVFVENKGQVPDEPGRTVVYTAFSGQTSLLFTNTGLIYSYRKPSNKDEREIKEERTKGNEKEEEAREKAEAAHYSTLNMEWIDANPRTQIVAEEKVNQYYTYPGPRGSETIKAEAYKKITYKNIYPFIDIEYVFPDDKPGIKYSIILHPGATPSSVKMIYENAGDVRINPTGSISISSDYGIFEDHAPLTFYENGKNIPSSFEVSGNTVGFQLLKHGLLTDAGTVEQGQKIIIDPWTTTPLLPNNNKAFEIGKDSLDNVYIYGGSTATLQKYDPNGNLLWTFGTTWDGTSNFGDLAVSPNGTCYITWFGEIKKINAAGTQTWSDNTSTPVTSGENWRCAYNCDYSKLVVALCMGQSNIYTIDVATNIVGPSTVTFAANGEIRALAKGFNGNFYGLTINGTDPQQIALSSTFTPIYSVPSGQNFSYAGFQYNGWGGQSAIAASDNFIFSVDGSKLFKRNINTGAIIDSTLIPGGMTEQNSGIDVDDCGNVYCGSQNYIYKFNSSLTVIDSIASPAAVYDLILSDSGIYACGNGFVSLLNITTCPVVSCVCIFPQTTNSDCTGGSNGTATIVPNGTGPYTYLWSNGQTTATATGLSMGTYTVTVTSGTGCVSTGIVTISPMSAAITGSTNVTLDSVTCTPQNNGTAIVTPTPGSSPYTYSWNTTPVQTNDTATGLAAGSYSVIVTDTYGCKDTAEVTINSAGAPVVTAFVDTFFCQPSIYLLVSGGFPPYSYTWSSGDTGSFIYIMAPGTYTYTVTATDVSGCLLSTIDSILIPNVGSAYTWGLGSLTVTPACNGNDGSAIVDILGAPSSLLYFSWMDSNGGVIGTFADTAQYNLAPGTYTCEVFDQMFCKDTVITIVIAPSLNVNSSPAQNICPGTSVTLTATGAQNYTWSPSTGLNTTSGATVIASPAATTTYSVNGTSGSCSQTDSTLVTVYAATTVNAGPDITVASGETVTLSATGSGAYVWSTGETGNTITVSPVTNTLYYVTLTDMNGCVASDSVLVTISCQALVFPNVYTPNEDGQNDLLRHETDCPLNSYKISIFNRWGDLIFESNDVLNRWDGKNKGKKCSEGVYYYIMDYQLNSGDAKTKTGFITLLR
jgi:gliding motility-associated-like protein